MDRNFIENITPEMLDGLTITQRVEIEKLLIELKDRKLKYPLLDMKLHDYQLEFDDAIRMKNKDGTPKYKFIVFLGGNGSGKTWYSSTVVIRKLMGTELCEKYGIPQVGDASLVKMYTTTGDNIRDNIDRKYLLGTGTESDKMKFPGYINKENKGEIVKSTRHDKDILKEIKLYNGAVVTFGTYDQGQARLQGGEPDFTWMDELPTRFEDLIEIWRGTRNKYGQLLISATPTNYNKKIHEYIFNKKFKDTLFIRQIDSFRNTEADHSWMEGLGEEEINIRRFGSFTPPEGLVYKEFKRDSNVIEFINPSKLGSGVKYYGSVDFGVDHPTAFLLIAIDGDGHIYIFDMYYEGGKSMAHLAEWINNKKREYGIDLEYIIADSAGARERLELKEEGIITRGAKKKQKENTMSNRRGGIMRVNAELATGNLLIADNCQSLISELETHHYIESGPDGSVKKTEDDALDALRYFIFSYRVPSEIKNLKKKKRKIQRIKNNKRRY